MKNSIVSIESVNNSSFGTGFVIDSDEKGVYILTCQHVLDDVEKPVIENVLAKVIAKGDFIDMAILYVSKLHRETLPLQTQECNELNVEVIGFSHFNKSLTQKKHINATLYKESIELHSKEDDAYYSVRKIKANDGFNFDRGNSGSPVICKNSGKVIAMISNKEGNDIGYAIDIVNLKEVWKESSIRLFEKQRAIIEPVSGTKDEPIQKVESDPIVPQKNTSSNLKYLIAFAIIAVIGFGAYTLLSPNIQTEKKIVYTPTHSQRALEEVAFRALVEKRYLDAKNSFDKLDKRYPKTKNYYEIAKLLRENLKGLHNPLIQKAVIKTILSKYSWKAPKGSIEELKEQLK